MKNIRLVTAISACASNLIFCLSPQAKADFLEDSKLTFKTQNYYYRNDFRDGTGQNQKAEWAQGFTANFSSGFTSGNIGFGLDAVAMLGLKLDSGPGRTGSGLLPQHDADDPTKPNTKDPADEYSKLNLTAKVRIFDNTLLRLGAIDESGPLVQPNTSRLFLQTFEGGWLSHKFSDEIQLGGGQFQRVRERDSTDYQPLRIAGQNGQYAVTDEGKMNLATLTYKPSKQLSLAYSGGQLEDVYKQHFLGAIINVPVGPGAILGDIRTFRSTTDGAAHAGDVDNKAFSGQIGYQQNGSTFRVGYQKMLGSTAFTYLDGTSTYLFSESLIANFTKQSERAWMLRFDQDFAPLGVPGLVGSVKHIRADNAEVHNFADEGKEWETDMDLGYTIQSGPLKELSMQWRHAVYHSNYARNQEQDRLIFSYPIKIL
ncbi:outer membrane porin, OprD family [Pseudomonas sp. GM49]|uniref:OprD family outer membrane porin n=1 Tax=Pseudomonas sp. GM49 TaxID=1144331 RepID=UPI00027027FE|nr:OprD family outer membrane porin [Pseudomonas sp. GM49]EJM53590.1 outer membrane porin, OprD family [Pseudomonas sp. GM49]